MLPLFLAGAALCATLLAAPACGSAADAARRDSAELAERKARLDSSLAAPGDSAKPIARWQLPVRLAEISGLALTPDGRLFAHGDENSRVFEIDYRRGVILKQFTVGPQPIREDFEGITFVDGSLILMTSNGKLYEFQEGADGANVQYRLEDTQLGKECEFEGIAYEAASNSLLLACKNPGPRSQRDQLVIYRWKREGPAAARLSQLIVPVARVVGANRWLRLRPTDLTLDPVTGNYVMVSAQEQALVEITPSGELVSARPLPSGHVQAEGVAITRDGILIVSDEGQGRQGVITLYKR